MSILSDDIWEGYIQNESECPTNEKEKKNSLNSLVYDLLDYSSSSTSSSSILKQLKEAWKKEFDLYYVDPSTSFSYAHLCIKNELVNCLEFLLDCCSSLTNKIKFLSLVDSNGRNALVYASYLYSSSNSPKITSFLFKDVHEKMIRLILLDKAHSLRLLKVINQLDNDNGSALYYAFEHKNVDLVRLLLKRQASVFQNYTKYSSSIPSIAMLERSLKEGIKINDKKIKVTSIAMKTSSNKLTKDMLIDKYSMNNYPSTDSDNSIPVSSSLSSSYLEKQDSISKFFSGVCVSEDMIDYNESKSFFSNLSKISTTSYLNGMILYRLREEIRDEKKNLLNNNNINNSSFSTTLQTSAPLSPSKGIYLDSNLLLKNKSDIQSCKGPRYNVFDSYNQLSYSDIIDEDNKDDKEKRKQQRLAIKQSKKENFYKKKKMNEDKIEKNIEENIKNNIEKQYTIKVKL